MNGDGVTRTGKHGRRTRGAGSYRRMIHGRRGSFVRQAKAQHDAASQAEVILMRISANRRPREIGHQVVHLHEAPHQVFGEYDIHATTGG